MNGEVLSILETLEKDKGIKKEILVAAVESALESAARKLFGKDKEISVELSPKTGEITVLEEGKEVSSPEFSRIAAQTAKQVIIQKIREAEREVIYDDFHKKTGTVVNGLIYRIEKGNVIVDLGKTEGILPRSQQMRRETYRQGERLRAYILEVEKSTKGPRIILSRTHSGLVLKLFELEVPEIYEGVVEIKAIAREAGERTKIAVYSKDEKIDSVGACVGMRGSRVKNIVKELKGEKIDIVRWNESTPEFIKEALSPAEISSIDLEEKKKQARVLVKADQLSLAIGKHGQNVRLACKITGWDIDIKAPEAAVVAAEEKPPALKISGVGKKTLQNLLEAGYKKLDDLAKANVDDITKVKGIGKKTAEKIIQSIKELSKEAEPEEKPKKKK